MTSRYPQQLRRVCESHRTSKRAQGADGPVVSGATACRRAGICTAIISPSGIWLNMQGGMWTRAADNIRWIRQLRLFLRLQSGCCTTYFDASNFYRNRERGQRLRGSVDPTSFTAEAIRFIREGDKDKPFLAICRSTRCTASVWRNACARGILAEISPPGRSGSTISTYLNAADEGHGAHPAGTGGNGPGWSRIR